MLTSLPVYFSGRANPATDRGARGFIFTSLVSRYPVGAILAASVVMSGASTVQARIHRFTMTTSPCGGASDATGSGSFVLDTSTGDVSYIIHLTGLTPVGVHVHGPADTCAAGRVAPVQTVLPPANDISGTFNLSPEIQSLMISGRLWINVHTELAPAGEITGQIALVVPAVSPWGLAGMAILLIGVGVALVTRRDRTRGNRMPDYCEQAAT